MSDPTQSSGPPAAARNPLVDLFEETIRRLEALGDPLIVGGQGSFSELLRQMTHAIHDVRPTYDSREAAQMMAAAWESVRTVYPRALWPHSEMPATQFLQTVLDGLDYWDTARPDAPGHHKRKRELYEQTLSESRHPAGPEDYRRHAGRLGRDA